MSGDLEYEQEVLIENTLHLGEVQSASAILSKLFSSPSVLVTVMASLVAEREAHR